MRAEARRTVPARTLRCRWQTVGVDGLSVPLAKGAQLQITFLTPATFTTPPTLIFFAGGISVSDP